MEYKILEEVTKFRGKFIAINQKKNNKSCRWVIQAPISKSQKKRKKTLGAKNGEGIIRIKAEAN